MPRCLAPVTRTCSFIRPDAVRMWPNIELKRAAISDEKLLLHPEVLKKGVHVEVADIDTGVREAPRYADIVSTLQNPVLSQDAKEIPGALGVLNCRKARKLQKRQVDKERRE